MTNDYIVFFRDENTDKNIEKAKEYCYINENDNIDVISEKESGNDVTHRGYFYKNSMLGDLKGKKLILFLNEKGMKLQLSSVISAYALSTTMFPEEVKFYCIDNDKIELMWSTA